METVNQSLHRLTWKPHFFLTKIQDITEGLIARVMKETKGVDITYHSHEMTYDDAMTLYGSDKPDTRFEMLWQDLDRYCQGD